MRRFTGRPRMTICAEIRRLDGEAGFPSRILAGRDRLASVIGGCLEK